MTTTPDKTETELVTLTIDGVEVSVPAGTLVIRAAEQIGVQVPRFCDHPLLAPAGACRQCLVEVEGQAKPLASCTTTVTEGMVVRTQLTSEVAAGAQHGQEMTAADMERLIRGLGRVPRQRTTLYGDAPARLLAVATAE